MLPSASAAKNTALIDKSGDFVMSAVATAALVKPPIDAALRFVTVPVNTPPDGRIGCTGERKPAGIDDRDRAGAVAAVRRIGEPRTSEAVVERNAERKAH